MMKKLIQGTSLALLLSIGMANAQNPGLIISEMLPNPTGTDSPFEYVELVASKNIDFSVTPYCVVVCNNGTATSAGWVAGGTLTYGFNITTGTVSAGDVVYVGGSSMSPTGIKLRTISTGSVNGDGFGTAASSGVFGNGGSNADGIAVFANDISTLTNSTVPVDAIFYGSAIGSALVSSGTAGYELPVNDFYSGGKLQSNSYLTSDPASSTVLTASGAFNYNNNTWATPRTWSTGTITTDGTSSVVLTPGDVTAPSALNAFVYSPGIIKIKFSEALSVNTASVVSNYTVQPSVAISSAVQSSSADSVFLNLSSSLIPGNVYTLSVSGVQDLSANTMTQTATFTLMIPGNFTKYTWKHSPLLGTYQGIDIYDGGFSGLHYIQGTNNEFYAITDRGPNLDANTNHHAIDMGGASNTAKLFPLPSFHPHMIHVKAQGDSLVYMGGIDLKRPDNSPTSGLTNPAQAGGTGEIALVDTNGTTAPNDVWGIDSEGLTAGNDHDYWIPEEYGVSIWHLDYNGKVINRYAPWGGTANAQPEDLAIDTIFKYRNPNKGFEGVSFLPNKKVFGFIQNSILFPASDVNLKKNTRLHRLVEIDTRTNTSRMLGYEHDKVPASGMYSTIKNDKRYVGDAVAVNDHQMLVLEHGKSSTESYAKIYLIDITPATPISTNPLVYVGGTKSFEQLLDSTTAAAEGVTVVKKTLFLDLIANGYDPAIEKEEGITIINDTCIAIANDNDFGLVSNNSDGVASPNGVQSTIYIFSVPKTQKLNLCDQVTISVSTQTLCQGDSVLLTTNSVNGITYQWKNNDVNVLGANTFSLYAKASGSYELFATNSNSCTAISNTKQITVLPTPTINISPSTGTAICQGDQIVLTAVSSATVYQWQDNSGNISGEVSGTYSVQTAGDYKVQVTDVNGCKQTSSVVSVSVNPIPTLSVTATSTAVCSGDLVTLTASGANTYSWTNGVSNGIAFTPTTTLTYTVTGTDLNNCSGTSMINVHVSTCTGIDESYASGVSVFPNPFTNEIYIQMNEGAYQAIEMYNQLGQKIELNSIEKQLSGVFKINLSHTPLHSGVYYLKLSSSDKTKYIRLVK